MFQVSVIHTTLQPELDDIYRRLAHLHLELDITTFRPSRLLLRAEIEAAQSDLVAALHRQHTQAHERSAPCRQNST